MGKPEVYISLDVETDGPTPGLNNMLSIGAAAFKPGELKEFAWFYERIRPLDDLKPDPDTMAWWQTQPEAWAEVASNQQDPLGVIEDLWHWLIGNEVFGELVAVGWPATFDFGFVNYYLHRFIGPNPQAHPVINPLGYACLDIRSYAQGMRHQPSYNGLSEEQVNNLAGTIDKAGLRDHVAVDDAKGQGRLLMALLRQADHLRRSTDLLRQ